MHTCGSIEICRRGAYIDPHRTQCFLSPFLKNPPNRLDFFAMSTKAKLFTWVFEPLWLVSNGLGDTVSIDQREANATGSGVK